MNPGNGAYRTSTVRNDCRKDAFVFEMMKQAMIMNVSKLDEQLDKKIREKLDSAYLVRIFNNTYKATKKFSPNLKVCRRVFMNAAAEHNHIELVKYLLVTHPQYDLNSQEDVCAPRPITTAVWAGNKEIVEILLQAGSVVNLDREDSVDSYSRPTGRLPHYRISPIEHACMWYQSEILKLLVYHDKKQNEQRIEEQAADPRAYPKLLMNKGRRTPLRIAVDLVTSEHFYDEKHGPPSPRTIFQLIIDAGGNVNEPDLYGDTPLFRLICKVASFDINDTTPTRNKLKYELLIETVECLLLNGSSTGGQRRNMPIYVVMEAIENITLKVSSKLSYVHACKERFMFLATLMKLLLKHGADPTLATLPTQCFITDTFIFRTAGAFAEVYEGMSNVLYFAYMLKPFNDLMDILGDLLRCLVLAGASGVETSMRCANVSPTLTTSFITFMRYSCQPGRSRKLITLLLNVLGAKEVDQFKTRLHEKLTRLLTNYSSEDDYSRSLRSVLEFVEGIRTPPSLMSLSRGAVIRHTYRGSLLRCEPSALEIPVTLQEYVMLASI